MINLTLVSYSVASSCLLVLAFTYFVACVKEKNKRRRTSVLSFLLLFLGIFFTAASIVYGQITGVRMIFAEYRGTFLAIAAVFLLYTSLRNN